MHRADARVSPAADELSPLADRFGDKAVAGCMWRNDEKSYRAASHPEHREAASANAELAAPSIAEPRIDRF